jgi:UDP-glucose 4-epimerase
MNILVCGGAGYIGSHMVKMLTEEGHDVTTFDNLSTGHREAVKWGRLVVGDLLDEAAMRRLFADNSFDAVMHFSAKSLVGESVAQPAMYYKNNVIGTFNLLEAMRAADVKRFVFSSSAATFGNPVADRIDENHPQAPINPYGETKLMVERMLRDYAAAYGLNSVSLRYFNAAGADPSGEIGEAHDPETHLIPNVLKAAIDAHKTLKVFGQDYPTPDGTCVRDYIHINDLCQAHMLALKYMEDREGAFGFNLGNGQGFSILEIINAAEHVIGQKIPYQSCDRRPGDPPILVADATLAKKELKWRPQYTDITEILRTAWDWHRKQSY